MYMGVKVSGESSGTSGGQPLDRPNVIKGLVREKRATSAPNFAEKNSCFSGYTSIQPQTLDLICKRW